MKRKIIIGFAVILLFLAAAFMFYNYLSEKAVVDIGNVKTIFFYQEQIDGMGSAEETTVNAYMPMDAEEVKIFLESLNAAKKKPVRGNTNKLIKEYHQCQHFRQIIIEMKDGTSTYLYYGYTDNELKKLPAYSFCKTGTCYKYSDDNLIITMDNMIDHYTAALEQ